MDKSKSTVELRIAILPRISILGLVVCTSGLGSKDGPHSGDRIKKILNHAGFLVSIN